MFCLDCDFLGFVHPVTQTVTVKIVYLCPNTHTRGKETPERDFYPERFGSASIAVYQLHAGQLTTVSQAHVVLLLCCTGALQLPGQL